MMLYRRADGTMFASSFSVNAEGWSIANGWYRMVAADAADELLGSTVEEGLRVGDEPVDVPASDHKKMLEPMLKAARARSFTAFVRDARAVEIERDDAGGLAVIPTRNPNRSRNASLGFMTDEALTVPGGSSTVEIGRTVRRGLDLSVIE